MTDAAVIKYKVIIISRWMPINAFIIWQAPRAGKIRRIMCFDWLTLAGTLVEIEPENRQRE